MSVTKKQIFFPVFILIIGCGLFAGLLATKVPAQKKDEKKVSPFVSLQEVVLEPIQLNAYSQGEVRSRYETLIVSQVSGTVMSVSESFVNGGLIKKGDLLVQIDPFDYQVRLQQANANLASARAAFIQERAQGRVAEAEWASITNAKPSELGLRKPQQEQALASVKASEAALTQAKKDLERTSIKAPYDALIKATHVTPGSFVNVGSNLSEILDISVAEVRLPIKQSDFSYLLNMGKDAKVLLSGSSYGKPYIWDAKIVRDEGLVDGDSRMIYLIAQIKDPYSLNSDHLRLPFGSYVSAEVQGEVLPLAARIERRLFVGDKLPVLNDDTLHLADVKVLKQEGKLSIVTSGIESGDMLVISTLDAPVQGMSLTWEGSLDNEGTAPVDKTSDKTVKPNVEKSISQVDHSVIESDLLVPDAKPSDSPETLTLVSHEGGID